MVLCRMCPCMGLICRVHVQWLLSVIFLLPLADDDLFAPGADALLRFVGLYRKMTALLDRAADAAPHPSTFPHIVAE